MIAKSKLVILASLFAMSFTSYAWAQQDPNSGKDFDPVTRALSNKNPPAPDPNAPATASTPQITPEQQAELDRQKLLADIAAKREAAKKKAAEAEAARKAKEQAAKEADQKKAAAIKAARDQRLQEQKQRREQLAALLKEQRDARKAYEEAKKNANGTSASQIDDDYRKAEKDREEKIKELRHPAYKPIHTDSNSTNTPAVGTTALPGTITSGSGPTVTQH